MSPTNRPNIYLNQASSDTTYNSIYYRNENNSLAVMNRYIHVAAMYIQDQAAAQHRIERHRIEIEAEAEADDIMRRIHIQLARNRQNDIANNYLIDIAENEANDHLIDIAENANQHQMG